MIKVGIIGATGYAGNEIVRLLLGHKDVNTTRKHYAAASEDRRRLAAKVVKLRED